MVFASLEFLYVFLPIAFIGWLLMRGPHREALRVWWLLVCSLLFYAYGQPTLLPLLLASITFNVLLGRAIDPAKRHAKMALVIGIAANLLLLAYFKYAGFFLDNLHVLAGDRSYDAPAIMLPLGISFFTFQHIAYLADRFNGKAPASSWSIYALFIAFFPQLIAGPIVHHGEMMPQFRERKPGFMPTYVTMGLAFLSIGLFKKTILADTFAPWADAVFDTSAPIDTLSAWLGTLSYGFQLYFDFSGYSDMAIGAALLFGIRLPINFLSPYAAASITEFWQRWHITLGRWLRDYLYIPLGGNRRGPLITMRNAVIVMTLCGLWHGAAWGFILWGIIHGVGMAAHRLWKYAGVALPAIPARLLTFVFVAAAWVPFRAPTIDRALSVWQSMFAPISDVLPDAMPINVIAWCSAAFGICMLAPSSIRLLRYDSAGPLVQPRFGAMIAAAAALFIGTIPLLLHEETPFLYFGF